MNNAKVMVTKEVAEAIEHFKSPEGYAWGNIAVVQEHLNRDKVDCEYRIAIRKVDADTLMNALINGYTIKKSPEEKVRDYYDRCVENRKRADADSRPHAAENYDGQAIGASITLDILGIKIEGVNA